MAERPRLPSDWLGEWHDRNGNVISCNFTLLPRGADGAKAHLLHSSYCDHGQHEDLEARRRMNMRE